MFVVVVWFDLTPGSAEAFRPLILRNAAESLKEPGCRQFDVCFTDDGRRSFLYEVYQDRAAFDAHKATAHFKTFDQASRSLVAKKTVEWYRREPPPRD
jgi:autoinducer 2-degrading protein